MSSLEEGGVYTHTCGVSYSCGNRTGDVPHQQQQRLIVGGESVKEELTPTPLPFLPVSHQSQGPRSGGDLNKHFAAVNILSSH